MNRYGLSALVLLALIAGIVNGGSLFTDVSSHATPKLVAEVNTALDALEDNIHGAATALSVTNGQAVTVAARVYVVSGVGGANDTTNTVTLAAPSVAGLRVTLAAATATTNLITIADSGTVAASGAILLDGNDTCELVAVDTSTWCLVSESNN
jgi:hypothetical protein